MEIGLNAMSINKEDVVKHLNEKSHCECFVRLFRLMMKLRNSMSNASIDYIKSPVLNKSETFFDSRFTDGTNFNGINNSDANGAYNIARKGIMLMERIRKPLTFESNAKFTCAIKNSDWFNYCTSFCCSPTRRPTPMLPCCKTHSRVCFTQWTKVDESCAL